MGQNRIEILIIADGKKAHATLVTTGKDVDNLGNKTKTADKNTSGFGKSVLSLQSALGALGLGAIVSQLGTFGVESFKAAAAAERLGAATDSLAAGIGSSGSAMVDAISKASLETISKTDAMTAANKAMMFGLVQNADQMGELTQVAITLGAAMGQDAGKSLDDLTTALGRQSPMILDNLGITLKLEEAYKIYAEQLGKTVEQLTETEKKQAFVNAALIKGKERVAELGGVTLDTAGKTEQFSAAWADFSVALGSLLTTMSGGIQITTAFVRELEKGAESWKWILDASAALNKQTDSVAGTTASVEALNDTTFGLLGVLNPLVGLTATYSKVTAESTSETLKAVAAREADTARLEGLAKQYQVSTQAVEENTTSWGGLAHQYGRTTELAGENAEMQDRVKEATEKATQAAKDAAAAQLELAGSQAEFILSFKDLQEKRLEDETEFNAKMSSIQQGAGEKSKEAATSLAEELTEIEQERAKKLAWVMDGAHARTAEQNAADLAHWNAHYDELKFTAETKTKEKTDAILAEQSRAEAAQAAAREKEKAEFQAHLDELKLQTALSMLETTGQLEQLTGLVGISASEAADLITAGVLPVTETLGVAMQSTLSNLESGMETAAATSAANQEIIQAAMDGTLTATDEMGMGTINTIDAVSAGFGTEVPASLENATVATTDFATSATENMNVLTTEAIMPFQELLGLITEEDIPLLEARYLEAMALMQSETAKLVDLVISLSNALARAAASVEKLIKTSEGMKKVKSNFESVSNAITSKLIPALDRAIKRFQRLEAAANRATKAARGAADAQKDAGIGGPEVDPGFQSGTPPGGFLVPSNFGTDEFTARFSGGERIFAFPNDNVPSVQNERTTNYYFNQTVNTNADRSTVIGDFRTMQMLVGA